MRFFTSSFTVLLLSVSALAMNVGRAEVEAVDAASKPKPKVCDPKAKGGNLAQLQYEALADFADLFVNQQDVLTAFNRYVPGEYKQHNPFAQQGRDFAIQFLTNGFAGGLVTDHLTIFGGQGYGIMHYKMAGPDITWAVADYFKFKGTCIVEHWDVLQQITGTEPNPIAFF
ncbi:hypothetical protein D9611_010277 [Ephemerocybe angulata]|uniref:SnoaL-like domain-containing protein n=1 Tax=Ephemerocybe angulata TaxID=980116 RepID=A0A8H5BC24_9AGAR|nr:hypothetical protein D9611_010277 [Tulosesus angulatus]